MCVAVGAVPLPTAFKIPKPNETAARAADDATVLQPDPGARLAASFLALTGGWLATSIILIASIGFFVP